MLMGMIHEFRGAGLNIDADISTPNWIVASSQVVEWLSNTLGLINRTDAPVHGAPSLCDIPEPEFEIPPKFLTSALADSLRGLCPYTPDDQPHQAAAAASSPAPANAPVSDAAAAASISAATAVSPQEPLPGPSAASDGGHSCNDQSILEKRRQQCFKVLTTSGLDHSMYLKYVNRLDFDDAVELLGQASKLADGVKLMVEHRSDDLSV